MDIYAKSTSFLQYFELTLKYVVSQPQEFQNLMESDIEGSIGNNENIRNVGFSPSDVLAF